MLQAEAGQTMELVKAQNCPHVQSLGNLMIFTGPGCPKAGMIGGAFAVSKFKCAYCREEARKG